jgi:dTDP-4-dehydrorhamnose reductase
MKLLIAGASGQLGRSLRVALKQHELTLSGRAELDVTDLESVRAKLRTNRPEVVINASAFNAVDAAESDPDPAFRVNAVGARNLALAAAEIDAGVVHVSTDYVFDGAAGRPYHEYDEPRPLSAYGRSKLAGERAVAAANSRHYIVRTAWLFHEDGSNFLNKMIALAAKGEVSVVNDQFGSPTYAPHLADAIARLIESRAYGVYHLAGRGGTSWYELTRTLFRELGIRTQVLPMSSSEFPRPAQRPRYSVLTTLQEPRLLLPSWKQGVQAFAASVNKRSQNSSADSASSSVTKPGLAATGEPVDD